LDRQSEICKKTICKKLFDNLYYVSVKPVGINSVIGGLQSLATVNKPYQPSGKTYGTRCGHYSNSDPVFRKREIGTGAFLPRFPAVFEEF